MRRTLTSERLTEIANHPDVRPWLGGSGPIDLGHEVSNPVNYCFLADDESGGYLYLLRSPGLYEVHTLSVRAGRAMLRARDDSLRYLFTQTDCIEIVTTIPDGNLGAGRWAAHAGFREVFRREECFDLNGEKVGASYRSLGYADWALRDVACCGEGRIFHEKVHRFVPDDHGDDPAHHHMVGVTILCARAGNAPKGLGLYNRWAVHAGYQRIAALGLTPLVCDIGSAVLEFTATDFDVLLVRHAQSAPSCPEAEGTLSCPLAQQLPSLESRGPH